MKKEIVLYLTEKHFRKDQVYDDIDACPMALLINESFPGYPKTHLFHGTNRYSVCIYNAYDDGTDTCAFFGYFGFQEFEELRTKFLSGKKFKRKVTLTIKE